MAVADDIARSELTALRERGLLRSLEPLRSRAGAEVELRAGERLINFSSNDYLGLAGDERIASALAEAARTWGAGSGASRLVCGDFAVQHELEDDLASFEETDAALLFNSGYAANSAMLPALAGPEDLIVSDALNHASVVDGCRLSRARIGIYPHGDADAASKLLAQRARRKLLVTESIFSMDGDRAPLRELSRACARENAILIVDEAHATGVIGRRGAGLCADLELAPDLRMSTHSKALGTMGAHVASSRAVCELLVNRARPLIYSTALPPAIAWATQASLRIAQGPEGDERRARLWNNVKHFASGLRSLGIAARPQSPIFPVVVGVPEAAVRAAAALRSSGILAKPIRPPTVPQGTSRIRFALSAAHTTEHLDAALSALSAAV